jgi:hypothetical protein
MNDKLPSGQVQYEFMNGLIVNVYTTTGTVTFQGKAAEGEEANLIIEYIDLVNMIERLERPIRHL